MGKESLELESTAQPDGPSKEFLDNTSMHGIGRVFQTPGMKRRIFWLVLFLCFVPFMIKFLVDTVVKYFSYPVTSLLLPEQASSILFPAVSFCNANSLRLSQVNASGLPPIGLESQVGISDEEAIRLSHMYDDVVLSCRYDGEACDKSADIDFWQDTWLGNCWTFNPTYNKSATQTGFVETGLELLLSVEHEEYLPDNPVVGFNVYIHDQNEPPIMDAGFFISPGSLSLAGLRMHSNKLLGSPHGNCETPEFYKGLTYSPASCRRDCRATEAVQECGCRATHIVAEGVPVCDTQESLDCFQDRLTHGAEECSEMCTMPCESRFFDRSLSTVTFPAPKVAQTLLDVVRQLCQDAGATPEECLRLFPDTYLKEEVAALQVYFSSLLVMQTTQEAAMGVSDLIGALGGTMGLFLGVSIMTLFEVVEFLMLLCRTGCSKQASDHDSDDESDSESAGMNDNLEDDERAHPMTTVDTEAGNSV